jgi:CubicO group peptidase (beta-lactamase class C family)
VNADVDVHGTVAEGFEPVREAFVRNFEQLGDRGAAVAVYRDGRRVVDLWAGTRDIDGTEPWERGTAQIVRSATKGVAAAVLLLLHQRGELDLDAPVGAYWPEFKAHGKERLLVRHVLNHRAGLPVLDTPLTPEESLDPARGPEAVAAQAPVWEPGTDHGYHALTYGWMLDELTRRVTGRWAGEWTCGWDCQRRRRRPDGSAVPGASRGPSPSAGCAPARSGRSPRRTPTRSP